MLSRTPQGFQGGTTLRLGNSTITIGGQIDRRDIRRVREWLDSASRYYQTAGYDTGSLLDDIAQGAGVVRDVANSPIGVGLLGAAGPYGAAALAAANGVPMALDALQRMGVGKEHAQTAAQLTHPDAKVRAAAEKRVQNITKAAKSGDQRAAAIRKGLQQVMAVHQARLLREAQAEISAIRQYLASNGDPMAYADFVGNGGWGPPPAQTSGTWPGYNTAGAWPDYGTTAGPAVPPELSEALHRALNRARFQPQPSFRRPTLRARA